MRISENVNHQEKSLHIQIGYIAAKTITPPTKINAIFRINLSVLTTISLIFCVSCSANDLYNAALVTPPIPAFISEIQDMNCVIEEVTPLYDEPNAVSINLGRISPQIKLTNSRAKPAIVLFSAFLLLLVLLIAYFTLKILFIALSISS